MMSKVRFLFVIFYLIFIFAMAHGQTGRHRDLFSSGRSEPRGFACSCSGAVATSVIITSLFFMGLFVAWWYFHGRHSRKKGVKRDPEAPTKAAYDNPQFQMDDCYIEDESSINGVSNKKASFHQIASNSTTQGNSQNKKLGIHKENLSEKSGGKVCSFKSQSLETSGTKSTANNTSSTLERGKITLEKVMSAVVRGSSKLDVTRRTKDDTSVTDPKEVIVPLEGHDFTGLGFNVHGTLKDGLFVKDVMSRGPANQSGQIAIGDRIIALTVLTDHIVYEDAAAILSYASPYPVLLHLRKNNLLSEDLKSGFFHSSSLVLKGKMPDQVSNPWMSLVHPVYRSQSHGDLLKVDEIKVKNIKNFSKKSPSRIRPFSSHEITNVNGSQSFKDNENRHSERAIDVPDKAKKSFSGNKNLHLRGTADQCIQAHNSDSSKKSKNQKLPKDVNSTKIKSSNITGNEAESSIKQAKEKKDQIQSKPKFGVKVFPDLNLQKKHLRVTSANDHPKDKSVTSISIKEVYSATEDDKIQSSAKKSLRENQKNNSNKGSNRISLSGENIENESIIKESKGCCSLKNEIESEVTALSNNVDILKVMSNNENETLPSKTTKIHHEDLQDVIDTESSEDIASNGKNIMKKEKDSENAPRKNFERLKLPKFGFKFEVPAMVNPLTYIQRINSNSLEEKSSKDISPKNDDISMPIKENQPRISHSENNTEDKVNKKTNKTFKSGMLNIGLPVFNAKSSKHNDKKDSKCKEQTVNDGEVQENQRVQVQNTENIDKEKIIANIATEEIASQHESNDPVKENQEILCESNLSKGNTKVCIEFQGLSDIPDFNCQEINDTSKNTDPDVLIEKFHGYKAPENVGTDALADKNNEKCELISRLSEKEARFNRLINDDMTNTTLTEYIDSKIQVDNEINCFKIADCKQNDQTESCYLDAKISQEKDVESVISKTEPKISDTSDKNHHYNETLAESQRKEEREESQCSTSLNKNEKFVYKSEFTCNIPEYEENMTNNYLTPGAIEEDQNDYKKLIEPGDFSSKLSDKYEIHIVNSKNPNNSSVNNTLTLAGKTDEASAYEAKEEKSQLTYDEVISQNHEVFSEKKKEKPKNDPKAHFSNKNDIILSTSEGEIRDDISSLPDELKLSQQGELLLPENLISSEVVVFSAQSESSNRESYSCSSNITDAAKEKNYEYRLKQIDFPPNSYKGNSNSGIHNNQSDEMKTIHLNTITTRYEENIEPFSDGQISEISSETPIQIPRVNVPQLKTKFMKEINDQNSIQLDAPQKSFYLAECTNKNKCDEAKANENDIQLPKIKVSVLKEMFNLKSRDNLNYFGDEKVEQPAEWDLRRENKGKIQDMNLSDIFTKNDKSNNSHDFVIPALNFHSFSNELEIRLGNDESNSDKLPIQNDIEFEHNKNSRDIDFHAVSLNRNGPLNNTSLTESEIDLQETGSSTDDHSVAVMYNTEIPRVSLTKMNLEKNFNKLYEKSQKPMDDFYRVNETDQQNIGSVFGFRGFRKWEDDHEKVEYENDGNKFSSQHELPSLLPEVDYDLDSGNECNENFTTFSAENLSQALNMKLCTELSFKNNNNHQFESFQSENMPQESQKNKERSENNDSLSRDDLHKSNEIISSEFSKNKISDQSACCSISDLSADSDNSASRNVTIRSVVYKNAEFELHNLKNNFTSVERNNCNILNDCSNLDIHSMAIRKMPHVSLIRSESITANSDANLVEIGGKEKKLTRSCSSLESTNEEYLGIKALQNIKYTPNTEHSSHYINHWEPNEAIDKTCRQNGIKINVSTEHISLIRDENDNSSTKSEELKRKTASLGDLSKLAGTKKNAFSLNLLERAVSLDLRNNLEENNVHVSNLQIPGSSKIFIDESMDLKEPSHINKSIGNRELKSANKWGRIEEAINLDTVSFDLQCETASTMPTSLLNSKTVPLEATTQPEGTSVSNIKISGEPNFLMTGRSKETENLYFVDEGQCSSLISIPSTTNRISTTINVSEIETRPDETNIVVIGHSENPQVNQLHGFHKSNIIPNQNTILLDSQSEISNNHLSNSRNENLGISSQRITNQNSTGQNTLNGITITMVSNKPEEDFSRTINSYSNEDYYNKGNISLGGNSSYATEVVVDEGKESTLITVTDEIILENGHHSRSNDLEFLDEDFRTPDQSPPNLTTQITLEENRFMRTGRTPLKTLIISNLDST